MKMKFLLTMLIGGVISASAQKTIVDVAVGSSAHTTLVAAVKAADLVTTLQSAGPFTVFAPVNAAFGKLPAGTVEYLLKPENKATLTNILTYHVVPGKISAKNLGMWIKKNGGKFLYCENLSEIKEQFENILEENMDIENIVNVNDSIICKYCLKISSVIFLTVTKYLQ